MISKTYVCPTCGSLKTIKKPDGASEEAFPASLPCGWRGCMDRNLPSVLKWTKDD